MQDESPQLRPECAETRKLFHLAFVEPAAEEEIMLHAIGCLECMDAFLELKDTVKQLETAATEIPAVDDFSSRVFAAIDAEEGHRRKRVRTLSIAAIAFFAGIAITLAITIPLSKPGEPGQASSADVSLIETAPLPGLEKKADPEPEKPADTASDDGHDFPASTELLPGDEPPPPSDSVEKILESIRAIERDIPDGRQGQRGRKGMRMRSVMHRISLLGPASRADLLKKLENEPNSGRPAMEKRFHDQIVDRIKSMPDNPLRRPIPPGQGVSKKSEK